MSKALNFYEKERLKFNSDKTGLLTWNRKNLIDLLSLNEVRCAWTDVVILKPNPPHFGFNIHKDLEASIWMLEFEHINNAQFNHLSDRMKGYY